MNNPPATAPEPVIENKRVSFRLNIEDFIRLEEEAAKIGLSASAFARAAVLGKLNELHDDDQRAL